MMRPSVQGVDPPVCCTPGCYCYICKRQLCGFPQCAASWMTYARDSFVDSQGGLLSSRGGGGGPDTLAPVLQYCTNCMCYCPTPKLSPHRKLCAILLSQKIYFCMIYKPFELWGTLKMSS